MRRVLFVWLPAAVIAIATVLGAGWGAWWWWENQPEQLQAAAVAAYQKAESARQAGDVAGAMLGYMQAEERFVTYFRDGPTPPPGDLLVLRYKTLTHAANLLASEEAARAIAPGRKAQAILGVARQCASQAAEDAANVEAQAAMLECCFREDQLDLAERYARNLLKHISDEQRNDSAYHPHLMGAYYVSARSALRRTPPQADEALGFLEAADQLQEKWVREQFGDKPVAPSVRYRWRLTYLESQSLAIQATPPRLVTGSRAINDARAAAERLQTHIAVALQRVRDETKPGDEASATSLAKLSTSDLRGLLDFMLFAIENSNTRGAAVERVELMLTAWDALLVGRKPSRTVQAELVERLGRMPKFLETLPLEVRPAPRDWAGFYPRWESIAARLLETGADLQPNAYLKLTQSAHKYGHYEQGIGVARAGIQAAEFRKIEADHRDVLELHGEAAWMCLLRGKLADADEHLAALRRQTKHLRGLTTYVEALAAMDDGQLDVATTKLQQVRQLAEYTRSLYPHLGLSRVQVDAGRFEQALPSLERLEQYYNRYENLPEEQQIVARRLGLHRSGVNRELFRTHLALGDVERAAGYKDQLREDPDWLGITVGLVQHLLGLAPTASRTGTLTPAALDAAKTELAVARRFAPDDPRLLLLEAEMLAARPGSASSVEAADRLLRDHLAGQENRPEAQLIQVVWQLRRARLDEANSTLTTLEKMASALDQERLPALRARAQLIRSPFTLEAEQLLNAAGLQRERGYADLHLAFADGRTLLTRPELAGLRYYRQALVDHAQGNLESAARGYSRALLFGVFRPEARTGLLAALLQIRTQDSPSTANGLAVELLQSRSDEPALMLAFIETAVLLDNLHGSQGAEGALEGLETLLRTQYGDTVQGPYFQARTWLTANRPDRALRNAERALEANPGHLPSLRVAVQATRELRDWTMLQRHAQSLLKVEAGSFEGLLGRAVALAGLGESDKALQAYKELRERFPDRAEGTLGPAALFEQTGNAAEALTWVTQRRERAPTDLQALQMEIRLRAKLGQLAEDEELLPANAGPDANLAIGRGLLEGGESDRALTWARRAEMADKTAPVERLARIRCLMGDANRSLADQAVSESERKKHIAEAIDHYRSAYRDVPGLVEAGRPLAVLLVAEGETGANAAFAIVQRLRQGRYSQTPVSGDRLSLELLDTLGVVYRTTGHHREAVTLFREASLRYPEEPTVHLHLGRALAALKRKPEAAEALDRATQLATERANRTRDVAEKAHWLEVADEAQQTR